MTRSSPPQLQDCFSSTLWDTFHSQDLQEHSDTVLSYVISCISNVTVNKRIQVFLNRNPWMTSEVKSSLKKTEHRLQVKRRRLAPIQCSQIHHKKEALRRPGWPTKGGIKNHFTDNPRGWQEINHIMKYGSSNAVSTGFDASPSTW